MNTVKSLIDRMMGNGDGSTDTSSESESTSDSEDEGDTSTDDPLGHYAKQFVTDDEDPSVLAGSD